jgi:hypothetical protein
LKFRVNIREEYAAPIFKVKGCEVRNCLGYIGTWAGCNKDGYSDPWGGEETEHGTRKQLISGLRYHHHRKEMEL